MFASIFGTFALLDARDRGRIDSFAINKFRGNLELLKPGIVAIEERVGVRCSGVIPHLGHLHLDEEDGVALERRRYGPAWTSTRSDTTLRIAVVALPHIANFTDFDALALEPTVDLRYSQDALDLALADVIVLPGSKESVADLTWLRARGIADVLQRSARERALVGICGGMQMLGRSIDDPHGIESGGCVRGLGILDLSTSFAAEKIARPVRGVDAEFGTRFEGYEMHVGQTRYGEGLAPFAMIRRHGEDTDRRDGAISHDRRVIGTYVHGLFGCDEFRHAWIARRRWSAGLPPSEHRVACEREREQRLDRRADTVRDALDLQSLLPELPNA
ncbi:MAG: cobyric acid synthase [Vulcanimicrobiaceae bacterium]